MLLNSPSLSVTRLESYSPAIHFIMKGVFLLVAFFLTLARFYVMAKIGCNAMRPEIGNFVAIVVCYLRD